MSQDEDFFAKEKPWSRRKRVIPLKTWSGQVVYKKNKHRWTQRDLDRILDNVIIEPKENQDSNSFYDELMILFQKITIAMMEKLLPFVTSENVERLYYWIYRSLGDVFNVDTTGYDQPGRQSVLFDILVTVADRLGFDLVKRK